MRLPADELEGMAHYEIRPDCSRIPEMDFVVESEVISRAVDKPFNERQPLGSFGTADAAYHFIEKYLTDTRDLHTYFSRQYLCPKEEYEDRIREQRIVAINVVLGQFEDMIYVRKVE
jgi:hypothetical protein